MVSQAVVEGLGTRLHLNSCIRGKLVYICSLLLIYELTESQYTLCSPSQPMCTPMWTLSQILTLCRIRTNSLLWVHHMMESWNFGS